MLLQKAKTITLNFNGENQLNFPDLHDLRTKNIIAINAVKFGEESIPLYTLFLNLTANGQDFFFSGLPLHRLDIDYCKGTNLKINRPLSISDCFIGNPRRFTGTVTLVIWYSDKALTVEKAPSRIDYADVAFVTATNNNFLPDQQRLTGRKIRNIVAHRNAIATVNNLPCVTPTIFDAATITLRKGTNIITEDVPLKVFEQLDYYQPLRFADIQFDFDNSYIRIADEFVRDHIGTADLNKYFSLEFKYI